MGAGDLLRDVDRRLLPPLARGLDRLSRTGLARHLRRPRPLTVAALASALAVAATVVWMASDQPREPAVTDPTRVGVFGGQSIPGYVALTRSKLARLVADGAAGRPYALVSLKAYLPPERLGTALAALEVAQVHTRVPLLGGQTEIERIPVTKVPADVIAGMDAVADRMDREAAEYASLSAKLTGDGPQEQRLRMAYAEAARRAATEAAAYRSRCSCVYAAVVRGAPAVLERVAERPEVLAVDPAPQVRRLDQAVFLPPLPRQTGTAAPPGARPTATSPHAVRREHQVSPDRPADDRSSATAGRTWSPTPSGRGASSPAPSSAPAPSAGSPTPTGNSGDPGDPGDPDDPATPATGGPADPSG